MILFIAGNVKKAPVHNNTVDQHNNMNNSGMNQMSHSNANSSTNNPSQVASNNQNQTTNLVGLDPNNKVPVQVNTFILFSLLPIQIFY